MAAEAVLGAIEAAVRALGDLGLAHALIGGAAMPAWGRIRATADADILIHAGLEGPAGRETLTAIVDRFRAAGFAHLERADRRRIEDRWLLHFWFPVRPQGFSVRVDLLVAEAEAYRTIPERAVTRRIDGLEARVASCEDLILLKLAAGRAIDVADARELLAINEAAIDWTYLHSQAARMQLAEALAKLGRGTA